MASVGRCSSRPGPSSGVASEDPASLHCWLSEALIIIAKVLTGKTRDRAIAAAIRTFALLGKDPKGCSGSDGSDAEVTSRLQAVKPVLQAKLNGQPASSTKRAMRNVAMHNFNVSFADGEVHDGNAASVQRGGKTDDANAQSSMSIEVVDASDSLPCAVDKDFDSANVGYSCPGDEYGGDTVGLRVVGPSAAHIDVQVTPVLFASVDDIKLQHASRPPVYDLEASIPSFPALGKDTGYDTTEGGDCTDDLFNKVKEVRPVPTGDDKDQAPSSTLAPRSDVNGSCAGLAIAAEPQVSAAEAAKWMEALAKFSAQIALLDAG
jgi:hypothetical protein